MTRFIRRQALVAGGATGVAGRLSGPEGRGDSPTDTSSATGISSTAGSSTAGVTTHRPGSPCDVGDTPTGGD